VLGVGGFFFLAVLLFVGVLGKADRGAGDVPSDVYAGLAIMAAGAGIVTLLGSLIGWLTVGRKQT